MLLISDITPGEFDLATINYCSDNSVSPEKSIIVRCTRKNPSPNSHLPKAVALKITPHILPTQHTKHCHQLKNEFEIMSKLSHRNITKVYDYKPSTLFTVD